MGFLGGRVVTVTISTPVMVTGVEGLSGCTRCVHYAQLPSGLFHLSKAVLRKGKDYIKNNNFL